MHVKSIEDQLIKLILSTLSYLHNIQILNCSMLSCEGTGLVFRKRMRMFQDGMAMAKLYSVLILAKRTTISVKKHTEKK